MASSPEPTSQSLGGVARAKALSPERRKEIAQAAVAARWGKPGSKVEAARGTYRRKLNIAKERAGTLARALKGATKAFEEMNAALAALEEAERE